MVTPSSTEMAAKKIIIALDFPSLKEAQPVIDRFKGIVGGFKVASTLNSAEGTPALASAVVDAGDVSFLDLKWKDIPFQVAGSVRASIRHGFTMMNLHGDEGRPMMEAAAEAAQEEATRLGIKVPSLIAVTVLTSTKHGDLEEVGCIEPAQCHSSVDREKYERERIAKRVRKIARVAESCGLAGVVASALELSMLRQVLSEDFLRVIPGIRLPKSDTHDQYRIATPDQAIRDGASYLVVGRDLTQAKDPEQMLEVYCRLIAHADNKNKIGEIYEEFYRQAA